MNQVLDTFRTAQDVPGAISSAVDADAGRVSAWTFRSNLVPRSERLTGHPPGCNHCARAGLARHRHLCKSRRTLGARGTDASVLRRNTGEAGEIPALSRNCDAARTVFSDAAKPDILFQVVTYTPFASKGG